jgi:hypothetical protein
MNFLIAPPSLRQAKRGTCPREYASKSCLRPPLLPRKCKDVRDSLRFLCESARGAEGREQVAASDWQVYIGAMASRIGFRRNRASAGAAPAGGARSASRGRRFSRWLAGVRRAGDADQRRWNLGHESDRRLVLSLIAVE